VFFATFNIQNYGVSKASKSAVLEALATTIDRYDVVTIQEISQMPDSTGVCGLNTESAVCDLQVAVNSVSGRSFALAISPRIGDEQYAVLYDSSKASYLNGGEYPDSNGTYSRPPYAFHLQIGSSSMVVASTHTSPSTAELEIAKYPSVIGWMEATFAADFYMVAGDYNADGSYFDEDTEWTSIMSNIPNYTLLTGNEMDTTLALSSNTYDRIIATSSLEASGAAVYKLEDHVNLSGVFQQGCQDGYINSDVCSASPLEWHEVAKELSDHYPVELCMHLNGTCDSCVAATTTAPVVLSAGSCAVVGFHADNPDDFGLLLLETVPANFVVYVTDRGVLSDGSLRSGEGILQYTSGEDVLPGTVLLLQNFSSSSGTFSLSSSGDQIIAFSGSEASPSFMCGINFEGTSWQSTADSASSSAVPPGLEASMAALALPETDNAAYVGNTTGTAQELLTRIQGTENWQSDNSAAVPIPTSFVLLQDPTTSSSTSGTSTVTSTTTSTSATTSTISTASLSITTTGTSATQSTTTSTAFTSTAAATATTATTTTTATTASTSTITETITTATVTTITATGSISSSTSREHGSSSKENLNTTTETMTTSSSLVETSTSTEVWETSTTGEGPMAVAGSRFCVAKISLEIAILLIFSG